MSNQENLLSIVHSIPVKKWESVLPITKMERLQLGKVKQFPNSQIIRCSVISTSGDTIGVYFKLVSSSDNVEKIKDSDLVKNEYDNLSFWYEKFRSSAQFHTIKPLFVLPEKHLIVTKESVGATLTEYLKNATFFPSEDQKAPLISSLLNVGLWLKHFHSLSGTMSGMFSLDWLTEYLDIRLKILVKEKKRKFPASYRDRILQHMEKKKKTCISEEECKKNLTHGDFNLSNIIVHGESVTVLDFGRVIEDSYLMDISRIYHQLFLMTCKPTYRPGIIHQLQNALLKGYGFSQEDQYDMFGIMLIRHTITHIMTITRFWQQSWKEKGYNYWVLQKELGLLDHFLSS